MKEFTKINLSQELPINNSIVNEIKNRLMSKNSPVKTAKDLINSNFDMMNNWKQIWIDEVKNNNLL